MRVNAKALIWIDGRLILAEQLRGGHSELSLPGGRVYEHESVLAALKREVVRETGLEIAPGRLVYVTERTEPVRTHDLELIFLAEPCGVPRLTAFRSVDLTAGERPEVRPAILDLIVSDAASGWRDAPRWLGSSSRTAS